MVVMWHYIILIQISDYNANVSSIALVNNAFNVRDSRKNCSFLFSINYVLDTLRLINICMAM